MDDLISRAAAIDALCKDSCGSEWCGVSCQEVVVIETLPSAQPDLCDGCDRYGASCVGEGCGKLEMPEFAKDTNVPNSDCISRQTAIDAFLTELTKRERKNLLHTWSTVEVKYFVAEMLERLPSAQPEITPDGTLKVTVDADVASVGRILLSQTGTQRGGLYYKDAEPEIIMCKDCKHYRKEHGWNCIEYTVCAISPIHTVIRKPDDYCSRAKRKE